MLTWNTEAFPRWPRTDGDDDHDDDEPAGTEARCVLSGRASGRAILRRGARRRRRRWGDSGGPTVGHPRGLAVTGLTAGTASQRQQLPTGPQLSRARDGAPPRSASKQPPPPPLLPQVRRARMPQVARAQIYEPEGDLTETPTDGRPRSGNPGKGVTASSTCRECSRGISNSRGGDESRGIGIGSLGLSMGGTRCFLF